LNLNFLEIFVMALISNFMKIQWLLSWYMQADGQTWQSSQPLLMTTPMHLKCP